MVYEHVLNMVGNTPIIKLYLKDAQNVSLYVKLEYFNPTGSVKDRAARYVIDRLLEEKMIDKNTTIIESSSGNFGIALSNYCRSKELKFICVIDPLISYTNETIIRKMSTEVVKVVEPDINGGYLLNRIKKINKLLEEIPNSYWINQYGNKYNAEAYNKTLAFEMCNEVTNIDYVFIGVSSGGTITGVSSKVKKVYPNAKIIAVDIVGSVVFGGKPQKRFIPGIGSSKVPEILEFAQIDDVVFVREYDVILSCNELLKTYNIFAGGSSGAVFTAIKQYFKTQNIDKQVNVVTLFADRGDRYSETVYNEEWCMEHFCAPDQLRRVE
ncbi:2,3-diaminopropionate biosynthesis protein SbnA [Alkaliphilus transvaalensis]|uniref:2,3-diaminopropionate biosynthesis protein SbnA n=1 Tax=Alkaliphilus transvaalensis TaxID=114628 RepID=UPI0004786C3E|nr:2,3-diaminopropionate biosynthesis protein SbnA [Alkaliphilus transvaalensis]